MSYEADLKTNYTRIHDKFFPLPKPTNDPNSQLLAQLDAANEKISRLSTELKTLRAFQAIDKSNILKSIPQPILTVDKIVSFVSREEGVRVSLLKGPQRNAALCMVRHIAFYLSAKLALRSLPQIGRVMNKDHTTVLHGVRRMERLRTTDMELDAKLRRYEAMLTGVAEEPRKEPAGTAG